MPSEFGGRVQAFSLPGKDGMVPFASERAEASIRLVAFRQCVFPVALFDALAEQKLNLTVDGTKIILGPGGKLIVKRGRKPQGNLLF